MSRNYKFHNPEGLYFVSFIEPREEIRAVAGEEIRAAAGGVMSLIVKEVVKKVY